MTVIGKEQPNTKGREHLRGESCRMLRLSKVRGKRGQREKIVILTVMK